MDHSDHSGHDMGDMDHDMGGMDMGGMEMGPMAMYVYWGSKCIFIFECIFYRRYSLIFKSLKPLMIKVKPVKPNLLLLAFFAFYSPFFIHL